MSSRQHGIKAKIVKFLRTVRFASLIEIEDLFVLDGLGVSINEKVEALNNLVAEGNIMIRSETPFTSTTSTAEGLDVYLELTPKGKATKIYDE